jgi:cytochrome c
MKVFAISLFACIVAISASAQTTPKKNTQKTQQVTIPGEISTLLTKHTCLACHKPDQKLVGPAYTEVAKKKYSDEKIVELIYKPQPANWPGYPPMAALTNVPKEDALKIAKWINSLAK